MWVPGSTFIQSHLANPKHVANLILVFFLFLWWTPCPKTWGEKGSFGSHLQIHHGRKSGRNRGRKLLSGLSLTQFNCLSNTVQAFLLRHGSAMVRHFVQQLTKMSQRNSYRTLWWRKLPLTQCVMLILKIITARNFVIH